MIVPEPQAPGRTPCARRWSGTRPPARVLTRGPSSRRASGSSHQPRRPRHRQPIRPSARVAKPSGDAGETKSAAGRAECVHTGRLSPFRIRIGHRGHPVPHPKANSPSRPPAGDKARPTRTLPTMPAASRETSKRGAGRGQDGAWDDRILAVSSHAPAHNVAADRAPRKVNLKLGRARKYNLTLVLSRTSTIGSPAPPERRV